VEFSEFECPFCGRFATEILPSISRRYIEPGLVLWAFRHRPFEAIHANAVRASEAAECAAEENRFWQMHDMMFRDQSHLDTTGLLAMAKRVGLGSKFEACLATNSTEGVVRSDLAAATKSGIDSTPTFLIGRINDGVVSVSVRILGAEPESTFARVLDELLKDAPDKDDAAKGRGGPP
jgi:protein-disulfide isomerase